MAAFHRAAGRAKAKEIPLAISAKDVLAAAVDVCPVLGVRLDYTASRQCAFSPSLDRIIPALGYVPGNIAVISRRANTIKNDATPEELLAVATWAERARAA